MAYSLKKHAFNILLGLDQLANAIVGGDPDMTISGNCGRRVREGRRCYLCRGLCWFLGKIDKRHCAKADKAESDEGLAAVL